MPHSMSSESIAHEKRQAAFSSVLAALLLAGLKIVVGISTNSLGILSEAAHSSFDLLAAGMTLFAVRYAAAPADRGHQYGHGKIENLSAFVEALLLLVTCGWIIWEAIDRLFFNPAHVEASLWALGVMVVSIVVDVNRSRMLYAVAKKHNSQALEADALHFATDIWSSSVVIVGICALYVASWLPEGSVFKPWLERADSLAALGVSFIVLRVSVKLARQAVNVLLDASDKDLTADIEKVVAALPGIKEIKRLRLRQSGPDVFGDMTVAVGGHLTAEETDKLRQDVEVCLQSFGKNVDIALELRPECNDDTDTLSRVRTIAKAYGLEVHRLEVSSLEDGTSCRLLLEQHIEFDPKENLADAHARVSQFEARLQRDLPALTVVSHLEPRQKERDQEQLADESQTSRVRELIDEIMSGEPDVHNIHNLLVRNSNNGLRLSFHCSMHPETDVEKAHDAASRIELELRGRLPELELVTVHTEPYTG